MREIHREAGPRSAWRELALFEASGCRLEIHLARDVRWTSSSIVNAFGPEMSAPGDKTCDQAVREHAACANRRTMLAWADAACVKAGCSWSPRWTSAPSSCDALADCQRHHAEHAAPCATPPRPRPCHRDRIPAVTGATNARNRV